MTYTATLVKKLVFGNERGELYNVTADAASGSVSTGLGLIDAYHIGPISMATVCGKWRINTNSTSAVANGTLFISSIVSGDNFFLTVYGRS